MNKLREIFALKATEVERAKSAVPPAEIRKLAAAAEPVRPFKAALENSRRSLGLIAEVKKASPSQGLIRGDFDARRIAEQYRRADADCLSVLTDETYFHGSCENLRLAREASGLPCLRKDFLADPYQVYESRAWGADCILLIVAGLARNLLCELWTLGKELGMDVLVEAHSRSEVEEALELGADMIGINNRNLADMSVSLKTSETLIPLIAPHALAVSESGLKSRDDLDRVQAAGARAVLIGTGFCAAPDIGAKVREVMGS